MSPLEDARRADATKSTPAGPFSLLGKVEGAEEES